MVFSFLVLPHPWARLVARCCRGAVLMLLALGIVVAVGARAVAGTVQGAAGRIDFNRDIRPILSENCFTCHGPDKGKRKAGLRLDVAGDALRKLESGEFPVVPGKPDQSRLLKVVSLPADHEDRMPPSKTGKQLSPAQVGLLRRWIEQGARWADHWAYAPPERPQPPTVRNAKWVRNDIDRFILARLEREGLAPNPEADRYTLVRRLFLDLTGLPPSLREVDQFVQDKSPKAYEELVTRVMASPHYGERLALAWLDQARYADTAGYHFDGFRQMHLWRDWVIQAFNENKPFDQFTVEQLAGDLLPNATVDQKIATGFHRNVMTNDEGGADPDEYLAKYMVDRVNTTAQVWLGTTMGCAECHDHKYDPISNREFYQLYAFFHNVPEKGLDGTRTRNPAPIMKVPSADQGARLLKFIDKIAGGERVVAEREAELPAGQEKWEKDVQAQPVRASDPGGLRFRFPSVDPTHGVRVPFHLAAGNPVAGKVGSAFLFPGLTNAFVQAAANVRFDSTNAFSLGAWIKPQGRGGVVLSTRSSGPAARGFDLVLSDLKAEVHLAHESPTNAIAVATRAPLASNVWQYLFVTYNGSQKATGVTVYLDGVSRPIDAPVDKLTGTILSEGPLRIGGQTNDAPFRGLIEDLRIYAGALNPVEVSNLAAQAHWQIARMPRGQRSEEQSVDLKRYFRANHAPELDAAIDRLSRLRQEKDALMSQIPDTMVMEEMEKPRDTFILIRGDFQKKGEKVLAGVPQCWPPLPVQPATNRLSLARWLVATNNPLTARVTVNRYWAMLFGIGLVKTSNDFGSQGERPSHPELLDWLACEFMRGPEARPAGDPASAAAREWDVKHLVRLLVTSATYRQSAVVTQAKIDRDRYNRLLSRGPRFRMDAELLRDNALAVSGLLDARLGGPSVKPYQPAGIWDGTDHKYEQSKGADLYRRGMYVFWKRAAHYPSFATFDAPSRETCTVQRPRTSTPLQSLVMMNDPVYVEAARALATRALQEAGPALREQIVHAFRLTLARPPQPREVRLLEQTFHQQHQTFSRDPKSAEELLGVGESPRPKNLEVAKLAAMTSVANVLLNLNETIEK